MAKGRPFAVFDIDGTLIRWQLYHAVADNLVKNGVIDGQRFETIRGARMDWKRRTPGASFQSYEKEVIGAYEQALAKVTPAQLFKSFNEVFEEYKDQVYTYTRDLISQFKAEKYILLAVSGSQSEIVGLISEYYGFDGFVGTEYTFKNDTFTGQKVVHARSKGVALKQLLKRFDAVFKTSVAVGDSMSDTPMLELVEVPIAFNPEKELFEYAQKRGWKVVIERKNMVYELEKHGGKYELVKAG